MTYEPGRGMKQSVWDRLIDFGALHPNKTVREAMTAVGLNTTDEKTIKRVKYFLENSTVSQLKARQAIKENQK